eukprot:NODE_545_length_6876_cov_0.237013.p1 type:complete len:570 gc:universal NODE_545_length_6876_cov_0.237013:4190-5899(+)
MSKTEIHSILLGCAFLSKHINNVDWHSQFVKAMEIGELSAPLKELICNDFYLQILKFIFPSQFDTSNFVDILVNSQIISNDSWLVANLQNLISERHLFHFKIHSNVIEMISKQLYKIEVDQFIASFLAPFPAFLSLQEFPSDISEAINLFLSFVLNKSVIDFDLSITDLQDAISSYLNISVKIPYFQDCCYLSKSAKTILSLVVSDIFYGSLVSSNEDLVTSSSLENLINLVPNISSTDYQEELKELDDKIAIEEAGTIGEALDSEPVLYKPTSNPELSGLTLIRFDKLNKLSLIPVLSSTATTSNKEKRQDSKASISSSASLSLSQQDEEFDILEEYHKPEYKRLPPIVIKSQHSDILPCDFDQMLSEIDNHMRILELNSQMTGKTTDHLDSNSSSLVFIDIDGSPKNHSTYLEERSTRRGKLLQKLKKVTNLQQQMKKSAVIVTKVSLPKLNTKTLVKNAIYMLLAGSMADDTRFGALQSLEKSRMDYHIVSLKDDKNHSYKALYRVENKNLIKIHGNGPHQVEIEQVSHFYKFDCGAKKFRDISQSANTSSNEFHASVHGIVINRK